MSGGEVFIIAALGIICGTFIVCFGIYTFLSLFRGKRGSRELSREEAERLEQLWTGIKKMEERMDNLETILAARRREKVRERDF